MPSVPAPTFSRQDAARMVLERLGYAAIGQGADEAATSKIVKGYEALHAEMDIRGLVTWTIDLAPRRVENGIVNILIARFRPDFKGGTIDPKEETLGWMAFNTANALAPTWAPIVADYS